MMHIGTIRKERLQRGWTVEFIHVQRRSWFQFAVIVGLLVTNLVVHWFIF